MATSGWVDSPGTPVFGLHWVYMPPVVLSIAGFDPSSGAGVSADIKTAAAHGCYGVGCITALTVQATLGVSRVEPVSSKLVKETLEALVADLDIAAIRIGMLGSSEVAEAVAAFLVRRPAAHIVLDPILTSSSGSPLLDKAGLVVLRERLLPLAELVTPNLAEAAALCGWPVVTITEMISAAKQIQELGATNVLVTGGHLDENTDVLRTKGETHQILGVRVESKATHGTGCALATAIACNLAKGMDVHSACMAAKEYVRIAIQTAPPIGKGNGPMNLLYKLNQ
jgi:hydroxymethylpyrimidine/phosphomethylpyrimidine kinase